MPVHHGSLHRRYSGLLRLLRLMRLLHIGEWQAIVVQALLMGLAGAAAALLFEEATRLVQYLFTGQLELDRVACFASLPGAMRLVLPALGALPAGLVLLCVLRNAKHPQPEYMEAFSLGNGRLPCRRGLLRSLSAVLSLGTGAAIGKEGALIQISAVAASGIGRRLYVSPSRLRLMTGCGAAAGMTVAFHTPLAACLFVCEVVVGTFSIGTLAPLLLASCAACSLLWMMGGAGALFELPASFGTSAELGGCLVLGLAAAVLGKLWVAWLNLMRRLLTGSLRWLVPRMMLAGLAVGCIAMSEPYIVGNGYEAIRALCHGEFGLQQAACLLLLKALMVAVVFGVGTMGGVLTPTLMLGAFVGYLFGCGAEAAGIARPGHALAYAFIGMAGFFAVAGRTPVTALLLVIELSMSARLIFPLMLAVGFAYSLGRLLPGRSLYDASVRSGPPSAFDAPLRDLRVRDLCRPLPLRVGPRTPLERVMRLMLRHPGANVPVQDAQGCCLGVVRRAAVLDCPLPPSSCAGDLIDASVPLLDADLSLPTALEIFQHSDCRALPVTEGAERRLVGSLSRRELYSTVALMMRRELAMRE